MKTIIEKDKWGENVTIKHVMSIGMTPIVPLFMSEFSKLIDQGHASSNMVGSNRSRAIYAEINNEVAGFIVYEIQEDVPKTCWIIFGTVLGHYRRRGLYKIMHTHLEQLVKHQGSTQIVSLVHVNNSSMLELSKQLNKHPVFYRVEKYL